MRRRRNNLHTVPLGEHAGSTDWREPDDGATSSFNSRRVRLALQQFLTNQQVDCHPEGRCHGGRKRQAPHRPGTKRMIRSGNKVNRKWSTCIFKLNGMRRDESDMRHFCPFRYCCAISVAVTHQWV